MILESFNKLSMSCCPFKAMWLLSFDRINRVGPFVQLEILEGGADLLLYALNTIPIEISRYFYYFPPRPPRSQVKQRISADYIFGVILIGTFIYASIAKIGTL